MREVRLDSIDDRLGAREYCRPELRRYGNMRNLTGGMAGSSCSAVGDNGLDGQISGDSCHDGVDAGDPDPNDVDNGD